MTRRMFLPWLSFPGWGLPASGLTAQALSASEISGTAREGIMSAETTKRTASLFVVRNYFLKNGSQPARLHKFMQNGLLPELQGATGTPPIFLDALIAPHMPQVMTIFGFESIEQWQAFEAKSAASSRYQASLADWERGDDPPYEEYSEKLLAPTPFCPPLEASSSQVPRTFEFRIYHSPTRRQLAALNERFAGPEIQLFHRCGIFPILYTNGLSGESLPNLCYLTPFESLGAREKAWAAFGADPEWAKVRAESIEKSGQISAVMHISLWRAAAYSPVR
jgi:NIPSNAP